MTLSVFQLENRVGSLLRVVSLPLELRGEHGHFSGSLPCFRGIKKPACPFRFLEDCQYKLIRP